VFIIKLPINIPLYDKDRVYYPDFSITGLLSITRLLTFSFQLIWAFLLIGRYSYV